MALTSDFNSLRHRIDSNLTVIKQDLIQMRRDDMLLLQQLLTMQHTISLLSKFATKRPTSSSSLAASQEQGSRSPGAGLSVFRHPPLRRGYSAPLERKPTVDPGDEDKEDDDDDDGLSYSFSSSISETKEKQECLAEKLQGALGPLPRAFTEAVPTSCRDRVSIPMKQISHEFTLDKEVEGSSDALNSKTSRSHEQNGTSIFTFRF